MQAHNPDDSYLKTRFISD